MSIYVIGDIQGCFNELLELLDVISFDKEEDQLWFTGDLVNRGPFSLKTLRFVKSLGESAITVLGNHDIHLLIEFYNKSYKNIFFQDIFKANDAIELIDWLRHRPLFHFNHEFCLLHAGIPPQWTFGMTQQMALLAEQALQGKEYHLVLNQLYGNTPDIWSENLTGMNLIRFIINCFTRMRYCDQQGRLDFKYNGPIGTQAQHLLPWFALPHRKNRDMRIIFGHWSSLGYHEGDNCYGIDTGCLWGGELTAIKLTDPIQRFSVKCLKKYDVNHC